jgi:hypothetical protein
MTNPRKLKRKLIAFLAADTDDMAGLRALGVEPPAGKTRKQVIAAIREKLKEDPPRE